MKKSVLENLKYDVPAGVVVFLVAVPLCLGIALASGAPFFSGLIAGIVGGLVIGSLSNAPLSVSGPAAGLTAIVLSGIHRLGSFETFLAAVVLAGFFQLLLGLLRAGSISSYFPGSVIKGMLTGIGIIIILKQIPHALGTAGKAPAVAGGGDTFLHRLLSPLQGVHSGVALITGISLALLLLWEQPFMKRFRAVPGALVAVLAGVLLNLLFGAYIPALAVGGGQLVQVPVAGSLPEFLGLFTLPRFSALLNGEVLLVAFTIAAVASVETLLCIDAVDKMDPQRRLTDQNRELKAQGIGNMVSGLLGGLPITSVIVRSSANVNAGARSKASTILHGALILVCCLFIPHLLNRIPLGALAAILLMTGYKLARPSVFRDMFAHGKYQWVPFLVTVVAVVGTDLLTGVGLGLLTSMVAVLYGNVKNPFRLREEASPGGGVRMILSEEVSFLNKARIKKALEELPPHSTVVIDAHLTRYIDFDVLELIREFRAVKAPERNIRCLLTGFREEYGLENHRPVSPESPAFAYVSNRELVGQEGKLMSN